MTLYFIVWDWGWNLGLLSPSHVVGSRSVMLKMLSTADTETLVTTRGSWWHSSDTPEQTHSATPTSWETEIGVRRLHMIIAYCTFFNIGIILVYIFYACSTFKALLAASECKTILTQTNQLKLVRITSNKFTSEVKN